MGSKLNWLRLRANGGFLQMPSSSIIRAWNSLQIWLTISLSRMTLRYNSMEQSHSWETHSCTVRKFTAIYWTRRFITALATTRQLSLSSHQRQEVPILHETKIFITALIRTRRWTPISQFASLMHRADLLFTSNLFFFSNGSTAPWGPRPPHFSRLHDHTF
jgi:hypothetical protein